MVKGKDGKILVLAFLLIGVFYFFSVLSSHEVFPQVSGQQVVATRLPQLPVELKRESYAPLLLLPPPDSLRSAPCVPTFVGNDIVLLRMMKDGLYLYIFDNHGKALTGFPLNLGNDQKSNLCSSIIPAVADLNDDGLLDFVVMSSSKLYEFKKMQDGNYKLLKSWAIPKNTNLAAPTIADLDGDGKKEIISWINYDLLYAWETDGSTVNGFPFRGYGDPYLSVATADFNKDGKLEIVAAGTYYDFNRGLRYVLYMLDSQGKMIWSKDMSGVNSFSPVIGDVDGDGKLEIVAVRSSYTNQDNDGIIFDESGNIKYQWWLPKSFSNRGAPALADLDGDGTLEIIFNYQFDNSPDYWTAAVIAYHYNGEIVNGWPYSIDNWDVFSISAPTVLDVNNDKKLEVIDLVRFYINNEEIWKLIVLSNDGKLLQSADIKMVRPGGTIIGNNIKGLAVIKNIDNDAQKEIVFSWGSRSDRGFYDFVDVFEINPSKITVPNFQNDFAHTGLF